MKSNTQVTLAPEPISGTSAAPSIERLIRAHPFLEGMSPHQYRILSDCAMQTHFGAGELIFREGEPANRFYLIQHGSVALESQSKDQGRLRIQVLGAGDVLGWSWLFPPYFWHFDARTLEPTDAIFLYGTPLRDECELDHDLGYELIKRMAQVMMRRLQATRWQLLKS
jgi:CRP/FNR family transcriptional regulator, cyclic AMP receptor protein